MSQRPIMDAGPGINFLSVNKERLLFSTLGALSVPEAVETDSEHLPDKNAMQDLYGRLRALDDGLPPLAATGLMALPCWQ